MRSYERSGMTYEVVATSTSLPRRRQAVAAISVGYRRVSISHPYTKTSGCSIRRGSRMTRPSPKRETTESDAPSQPAPVYVLRAAQARGGPARWGVGTYL